MGQEEKHRLKGGLTRRDFLKASAAAAAAGGALNWAVVEPAAAAIGDEDSSGNLWHTTCPYCSASCGQIVAVGNTSGNVIDIWGDKRAPWNMGGLCAKGAGAHQLVTNPRRLGVEENTDAVFTYDASANTAGIAYKRVGNGAWARMGLTAALTEIVGGDAAGDNVHAGLVSYRGSVTEDNGYNSKGVAFFGSSHMNNEANYLYRKIVANFGTSNTEHQARI